MNISKLAYLSRIVYYMVKKYYENPEHTVLGKEKLEYLMYLYVRNSDNKGTIRGNRVYIRAVEKAIELLEELKLINIVFVMDKGNEIFLTKNEIKDSSYVMFPEKTLADNIIEKYSNLSETNLQLITLAYYIIDNFGIDDKESLVNVVSTLLPVYHKDLERLLVETGVIKDGIQKNKER